MVKFTRKSKPMFHRFLAFLNLGLRSSLLQSKILYLLLRIEIVDASYNLSS